MLDLNNLPFLKPPNVGVSDQQQQQAQEVMDTNLVGLARLCTYLDCHLLLLASTDSEFAVVDDLQACRLLGTVRRSTLARLLDRHMLSGERGHLRSRGASSRWEVLRESLGEIASPVVPPSLLRLLSSRSTSVEDRAALRPLSPSSADRPRARDDCSDDCSPPQLPEPQLPEPQQPPSALSDVALREAVAASQAVSEVAAAAADGGGRVTPLPPSAAPVASAGPATVAASTLGSERSGGDCGGTGEVAGGGSDGLWSVAHGCGVLCGPRAGESLGERHQADGRRVDASYSEFELSLLRRPLDLGFEEWGGASAEAGASAGASPEPESGLATPSVTIERAPNITVAGAPLDQVHMQFSVLGLERTYVTYAGRLLGVIRRSQLGGRG